MGIIEWNESFLLNIKKIDNQHKKLVDLINKSSKAAREDDLHQVHKLLNELRRYAFFHFSTEEEYMEKVGFEEIDEHIKEHSVFITDLIETIERINSGKPVKLEKIIDYLEKWVIGHVLGQDKKFGNF